MKDYLQNSQGSHSPRSRELLTQKKDAASLGQNFSGCVLCGALHSPDSDILISDDAFVALLDKFPVNLGHTLIAPRRHVSSVFDLTASEWIDLQRTLLTLKAVLDDRFHAAGYNLGINDGETAGQTIFHLHLHVIPRYVGDVSEPRGGIRNFKKPLVPYP
jgi:diadenosine tetraphosphate (Ap4A) HIT family hydrolase